MAAIPLNPGIINTDMLRRSSVISAESIRQPKSGLGLPSRFF